MAPRRPLVAVVSPYHLTTREAPAMAALLLADRAVTLRPAPLEGESREEVGRAMDMAPRFLRLLDAWRWSSALWHEGVLAAEHDGEGPEHALREMCREFASGDRLRALRQFAHKELFDDERAHLEMICRDLLRGGPDPGVSIPAAAALDRFGAEHGLWVVRADATSVAQRAEAVLSRRLFEVAVPVLLQASAKRVLEVREALGQELADLRAAMVEAAEGQCEPGAAATGVHATAGVRDAAKRYSERFEELRDGMTFGDDDEGARVVVGWVTLTASVLPADAVWRSSLAAMGRMTGRPPKHTPNPADPGPRPANFVAMTIRGMSISPDRPPADAPGAAVV